MSKGKALGIGGSIFTGVLGLLSALTHPEFLLQNAGLVYTGWTMLTKIIGPELAGNAIPWGTLFLLGAFGMLGVAIYKLYERSQNQ